eukprot:COSAG02_NODE_133_length_34692_cov_83.845229_5_plen_127_part_00
MFLCSGKWFSGFGAAMAWVAWVLGVCMLIVSERGQEVVLDEPERHLAGERRRDEADNVVSACCPISLRVCGLMFLCSGGCFSGLGLRWHGWLGVCMLTVSERGQLAALDEPERHLAGECRRDDWGV